MRKSHDGAVTCSRGDQRASENGATRLDSGSSWGGATRSAFCGACSAAQVGGSFSPDPLDPHFGPGGFKCLRPPRRTASVISGCA